MALDKRALKEAIEATFETAKAEEWTTAQVAESLADAVDAFVRAAEVVGIHTKVRVDPGTGEGTGAQVGTGRLQ